MGRRSIRSGAAEGRTTLGLVALVKLLAATVPIGVAYAKVPGRWFWCAISWAGGLLLVVYGGINTVVGAAVPRCRGARWADSH